RIVALAGKAGILTQEAVARMNSITPSFFCHGDDLAAVEVSSRATSAQRTRLVGSSGMERLGIVLRKNRNCADTQFRGGAHDTDGNLATIRDKKATHESGTLFHSRATFFAADLR